MLLPLYSAEIILHKIKVAGPQKHENMCAVPKGLIIVDPKL